MAAEGEGGNKTTRYTLFPSSYTLPNMEMIVTVVNNLGRQL